MALDLAQYATEVKAKLGGRMGVLVDNIQDAINQVATLTGSDATQHLEPPDPPQALNVKAAGGMAHVAITDDSTRSRSLNYFVEYSTDPTFQSPAPHVAHLGASRGVVLPLPNKNDAGDATPWHFRAYSMQPGSRSASKHQYFGSGANPTPVDVGGNTSLTLLPSTGSGTASSTGQEAGQGFGTSQFSSIAPNKPKPQ